MPKNEKKLRFLACEQEVLMMIFKIMIRIKCSCSVGYSGPTCSGSSCGADSCANQGVCEIDHQNGGFICHCKTGFTGPTCLRFLNVLFYNMIFFLFFLIKRSLFPKSLSLRWYLFRRKFCYKSYSKMFLRSRLFWQHM